MPMVVLEALACGVPVIATEVEGTPEVVRDGQEGVLAEPQSASSLAESIRRFISDREAWCRWSHQCVERHRSGFSDIQMATKTARLYHRIVDHFDY
jgi:glycosyltransferase involved in cell wall biosynthesis